MYSIRRTYGCFCRGYTYVQALEDHLLRPASGVCVCLCVVYACFYFRCNKLAAGMLALVCSVVDLCAEAGVELNPPKPPIFLTSALCSYAMLCSASTRSQTSSGALKLLTEFRKQHRGAE